MTSKYFNISQTQLFGTFLGIGLVYYFLTLLLPLVGTWYGLRQQKQQELDRLAKRQAENRGELGELEELVANEQRRAKEIKAGSRQRERFVNVEKFQPASIAPSSIFSASDLRPRFARHLLAQYISTGRFFREPIILVANVSAFS